jgi:hypothetical protein
LDADFRTKIQRTRLGGGLALEASTLLGRGVALSPRRRLVLAVVVVLVLVSMLAMAFHGFGGDGVEHHGLDHD